MRKTGPPPDPTAIKNLKGNPHNRPINQNEPKPVPIPPKCPTWLKGEARKAWKDLAPKLDALGVLTELDKHAFEAYCQIYARWRLAEEQLGKGFLTETPNGHVQPSPYNSIANQCLKLMRDYLAAFGMTPSDRTRISATPKASQAGDFTKFFSGPPPLKLVK